MSVNRNGNAPEPIIPRAFDEACPHCTALGAGKIDNYELEFLYVAPSSENGITTHILVYFRDEHGNVKYISIPIGKFGRFFE